MNGMDMSAIREAIQARESGDIAPMGEQMMAPSGELPTGGVNTPSNTPPQPTPRATGVGGMPAPQGQPQPQGEPGVNLQQPKPRTAVSSNYDDETRSLTKQLINKLMGVL